MRRAFINAPGTSAVWLADDDDGDGVFDFQQVLGPDDGIELPMDMVVSSDATHLYVSNWFANTVQQFDISDPFHPRCGPPLPCRTPTCCDSAGTTIVSTSPIRCSRRGTTTPTSANHATPTTGSGCSRSDSAGDLTPLHADGRAWVSFTSIDKQTTTGPAGPHMMLFDPSVPLEEGEH